MAALRHPCPLLISPAAGAILPVGALLRKSRDSSMANRDTAAPAAAAPAVTAGIGGADQVADGHRRQQSAAPSRPGLRSLAEAIDRVAQPLTRGQRRLAVDLALAWPQIVGPALAATSLPDRAQFPPKRRSDGTLSVRVGSGAAALELQHDEARVCERINAWLGFRAIVRLRLVHRPLPAAIAPPPPPPSPSPIETAAVSLAGIDSPRLRESLVRLGRRVGCATDGDG